MPQYGGTARKQAILRVFLKIAVGRADRSEVTGSPHVAANALIQVPSAQPWELSLKTERQLAKLVEKQCSSMLGGNCALARDDRVCERAALMTKQLGPGERRHDRRAVDNHQVALVRTPIEVVNESRGKLLAGVPLSPVSNTDMSGCQATSAPLAQHADQRLTVADRLPRTIGESTKWSTSLQRRKRSAINWPRCFAGAVVDPR